MLPAYEGSRHEFMELLASQDEAPAFARRAQDLETLRQAILSVCQAARGALLEMPQLRLAQLHAAMEGDWSRLHGWLLDLSAVEQLQTLHAAWQPQLRVPVSPTNDGNRIRQLHRDLVASFDRFNRRWQEYLHKFDFQTINAARADYNKYYVIEKACALGNERLARYGFVELPPMDAAEILVQLPYLP